MTYTEYFSNLIMVVIARLDRAIQREEWIPRSSRRMTERKIIRGFSIKEFLDAVLRGSQIVPSPQGRGVNKGDSLRFQKVFIKRSVIR
jgi:hypothetical protein